MADKVVGDVISLVGFTFAIWQLMRAKTIAEQVKASVDSVRQQLQRKVAAIDLNELIRDMEEAKEISRSDAPALSLRRFTAIRLKLITVRSSAAWSAQQQTMLQQSISQFSDIEQLLESALKRGQSGPKDLSKRMNLQIDNVATLLAVVQNERGRSE